MTGKTKTRGNDHREEDIAAPRQSKRPPLRPRATRPPLRQRPAMDEPSLHVRAPLFACIPRALLAQPPIRHRHSEADKQFLVTPFEFAVAAGLVCATRLEQSRRNDALAYEHGGVQIKRERAASEQFKADWRDTKTARRRGQHATPAPQRCHTYTTRLDYQSGDNGEHIKRAGRHGFRKRRATLRKRPPPETLKLTMTRSAVLRSAGLPSKGANLNALDAALERLCNPVGELREALLREWRALPSGQLLLTISGKWLGPRFVRIPMPVPMGASALALYLFAHGVNTGPVKKRVMIPWDSLCKKLGMPPSYNSAQASRALGHALDTVNAHLEKLDAKELKRQRVNLPLRYDINNGAYVRIVAIPRHWRDDDHDEMPDMRPVPVFRRSKRPKLRQRNPAPVAAATSGENLSYAEQATRAWWEARASKNEMEREGDEF
jgi:hypothetical protein